MKAYYDKDKEELTFESKDVKSMLQELNILKNTVIVAANSEIVTEDYIFQEGDEIKILSVVSGG